MKDLFFSNTNLRRRLLYCVTVMSLMAAVFWFGVNTTTTEAGAKGDDSAIPQAAFPANAGTLGAIPDGPGAAGLCGGNRDVTFTVTGMTAPLSNVEVSFSQTHTWVGDMQVQLLAPGGAPAHLLFSRTGAATAASFGDDSNMTGPYNFKDSAAGTHWWTAAAGVPTATSVPTGDYRSVATGPSAAPPALTTITTTFAPVTTGQANADWILRFNDCGGGDTGSVTAATLTLTGGVVAPTQHVVDFDGDGRTDSAVVRNTGGGPGGQIGWFFNTSTNGLTVHYAWGIATDFFVPEDYDGDGKTDVAVWRGSTGEFYILQSMGNTLRQEQFGQSGDDPTVVGDYNNDNKADLAVYRSGQNAGDPSTWFYRTTPNGSVTFVPWGQNGDFPAPGDYDGDGSNDFVIQRNNGGGQGAFWKRLATGATPPVIIFGTPTDVIVPGDYDGDGKTDIAVIRGIGGQINWFWQPSGGGADVGFVPFGNSATDFPTQGDWDDDGKTDFSIWRPSATPGSSAFWYQGSAGGGAASIPFGQNGDYPVANFNAH